jgi:hypothetical protein
MSFATDFGSKYLNVSLMEKFLAEAGLPPDGKYPCFIDHLEKEQVARDKDPQWVVHFVDATGQPCLKPYALNQGNGALLADGYGDEHACAGKPIDVCITMKSYSGKPTKGITLVLPTVLKPAGNGPAKPDELDDAIPF